MQTVKRDKILLLNKTQKPMRGQTENNPGTKGRSKRQTNSSHKGAKQEQNRVLNRLTRSRQQHGKHEINIKVIKE